MLTDAFNRLTKEESLGGHRKVEAAIAGRWILANQLAGLGLQLLSVILLTRLLVPADFGLLAIPLFFYSFILQFGVFGLFSGLVQQLKLELEEVEGLFALGLFVSLACALGLVVSAPLLVKFYGNLTFLPVTVVLALTLPLECVSAFFTSLLNRNLRYDWILLGDFFSRLVALTFAIGLALCGAGVWALVVQIFISSVVRLCFFMRAFAWRPIFRRQGWFKAGALFRFGLRTTSGNLVNYLTYQVYPLALGRFGSIAATGFFNRGQALFLLPFGQASSLFEQYFFPRLSAEQANQIKFQQLLQEANHWYWAVLFPLCSVFIVSGRDLVAVLFGTEWSEAGAVTSFLAMASIPSLLTGLLPRANAARARPARCFWLNLVGLPFLMSSTFFIASSGAAAVAAVFALYRLIMAVPSLLWMLRGLGLDNRCVLQGAAVRLLTLSLLVLFFRWLFVDLSRPFTAAVIVFCCASIISLAWSLCDANLRHGIILLSREMTFFDRFAKKSAR